MSLFSQRNTKLKKQKSWKEKMEKLDSNWEESRNEVIDLVKATKFLNGVCNVCQTSIANIKCRECALDICNNCDTNLHQNLVFHNRYCFTKQYLDSLSPSEVLDNDGNVLTVGMKLK